MNDRKAITRGIISVHFLCCLMAFVLAGCINVRMMSDYDQQTDASITAFQKKIETFLTSIERNAGRDAAGYENNVTFYDEVRVDLSSLRVRAAAIPRNDMTIKMIDKLQDSMATLEQLHREGEIPAREIYLLRSAFNSSCTAILKLELAKKRGKEGKGE